VQVAKLGVLSPREQRLWGERPEPWRQQPSAGGDRRAWARLAVSRPVRRAPGFTLLEVMVAIVLMSIVALVAYGAAQVSFGVHARLGEALTAQQSARGTREWLQDALRNARAPQRADDTTFVLRDGRLSFVAAGAEPPLDLDYDWRITIEPESAGLAVRAIPVGRGPAREVAFRLPGVVRWEMLVLDSHGQTWMREWSATTGMPRAVAITLWDRSGQIGAPLQLGLPLSNSGVSETSGVP
jgi:prepilin-type N-terminal cleavage/methylation domain-containing protein